MTPGHQELRWAVEYEKNIILVRETDTRHGGIEMKDFFAQVPEDLLPVFKNNIAIPWYREKGFRGVSVHTILKRAALEDEAASELQKLQAPGATSPSPSLLHVRLSCAHPASPGRRGCRECKLHRLAWAPLACAAWAPPARRFGAAWMLRGRRKGGAAFAAAVHRVPPPHHQLRCLSPSSSRCCRRHLPQAEARPKSRRGARPQAVASLRGFAVRRRWAAMDCLDRSAVAPEVAEEAEERSPALGSPGGCVWITEQHGAHTRGRHSGPTHSGPA